MTKRYRTHVVNWKQPRRLALLLVGVLAAASLSAAVYAAFLGDTGTVDVEVPNNTQSVVDEETDGGAFISYFGDQDTTFGSSGTGTFEPFVRLQASPDEEGYNTDGDTEFDTKTGTWTHAIKVSEIPQRPCPEQNPPPPISSLTCFELFVDINEQNSDKQIALNKVEIYFTDDPELSGYPFTGEATLQYSFDGDILINDVNQGSGRGDLRYDIPINKAGSEIDVASINCNYGNPLCETYFVLYSQWGTGPSAAYDSEGGFEEWKVRIYPTPPDVTIAKEPDAGDAGSSINAGANAVFTIVVTNNGPIAAENVTLTDVLPDSGLSWTVGGADAAACAGTNPHAGGSTLTCNFGTIPFPGSRTITLTSPTDPADCGVINNTGQVSSTNEDPTQLGNNSDSGSITVNCAAILIQKKSTKSTNPLVANAGVVFSVTGPGSYSASVTDNGTGDEDNTIGQVCISGLAPGTYTVNETTPPSGYGGASETNVSAVASNGTNCGLNKPSGTDIAVFTNPPLGDIQVNFRDGGSGETSATIDCVEGTTTLTPSSTTPPTGWDTSETHEDLDPGTYVCTVVLDP